MGRPLAFTLTPGQAADCRAAEFLLRNLPPDALVLADRAYDADAVRAQIEGRGSVPNNPSERNRRWKHRFSPVLTASATPSSGCSAASRISAASPPATTSLPPTSSPPSNSPQSSATGYESGP